MLVHICCSVDSHYFLKRLRENYPSENIIGYFYNPNIHPYSEYQLRYQDVKYSCKALKIKLLDGKYDLDSWYSYTKDMANEPEKGKRCELCFDFRITNTAKKALELGENTITTTLLMSPKKSFLQLNNSLKNICDKFSIKFIAPDYRKNGGTTEQMKLAKDDNLYAQNYCGCIFALNKQRHMQNVFMSEMINYIGKQKLPNSIEEKLSLYKKAHKLKDKKVKFTIIKDRFLNYRLLSAYVKFDDKIVDSYILYLSKFRKESVSLNLQKSKNIAFCKDEIKFISLNFFNETLKTNYKNVREILYNPPSIKKELKLRKYICGNYSLSPIIVLDKIQEVKAQICVKFILFEDIRHKISKFK